MAIISTYSTYVNLINFKKFSPSFCLVKISRLVPIQESSNILKMGKNKNRKII